MPASSKTALPAGAGGALPLLAYACLASSMALVGSYVALSKLLIGVFPVLLLAWLRFGIAAVAMTGWCHGKAPKDRLRIERPPAPGIACSMDRSMASCFKQ